MNDVVFRIWGCRGSIPSPGPRTVRFGGDTTCFEIRAGGARLVIDCGTGMRALGRAIARDGDPRVDALLTHPHLDHLLGLSFFEPLVRATATVTLWSDRDPASLRAAVDAVFAPPAWPFTLTEAKPIGFARLEAAGADIAGFHVTPFQLNHPGGATGYEVRIDGRRIVIVADHEHGDAAADARIQAAAEGADLVVYDAPYSDEDYATRHRWGHSTQSEALRLAEAAGPKRLLITHHDPNAEDDALDAIEARLRALRPTISLARDGAAIML